MNRTELLEAAVTLQRCAAGIVAASPRRTAELAAAAGALSVQTGAIGAPLARCFDLARAAGLDLTGVETIRGVANSHRLIGAPAKLVAQAVLRNCLVVDARLLAATTFTNRDDIEARRRRANEVFDAAAEFAADSFDQVTMRAITALHAAVTRDLVARSRPLPRIATYAFGSNKPALALANRLYGDAARAAELQAENRAPHPLFMPTTIRALTA